MQGVQAQNIKEDGELGLKLLIKGFFEDEDQSSDLRNRST